MRRTMHKWFFAWDFDKEEKWLAKMSARGLSLVGVGFCKYVFEDSAPDSYSVRLELLENHPTHAESQQYIKFVEETGAEYIGSVMRWAYFRKRADSGEFKLYTDTQSRIKQLNGIITILCTALFANIFASAINLHHGISLIISSSSFSLSGHFFIGMLCLGISAALLIGIFKVLFMRKRLRKEQNVFE